MLTGYYGNPYRRSTFIPEGSMTAYKSGDTIATNSYASGKQEPEFANAEGENSIREEERGPAELEPTVPQTAPSAGLDASKKQNRVPKRKQIPSRPLEDDEEDENDEYGSYFPLQMKPNRRGNYPPSYNAFFPIVFGGQQGSRTRGSEGAYPGSATAIANSFSTGKGGVASSHAVAYGDPYAAAIFRNNSKRRMSQQE